MTPADLTAIWERAEKATAGPWITFGNRLYMKTEADADAEHLMLARDRGACWIISDYDASFIAHAREDVPALVAEVERLRKALEAAKIKHAGERDDECLAGWRDDSCPECMDNPDFVCDCGADAHNAAIDVALKGDDA